MSMATDLVHNLELNVEKRGSALAPLLNPTEQQLDEARAYLAYCYVMNTCVYLSPICLVQRAITDSGL